jgi:PAS domain S-box-containing protein
VTDIVGDGVNIAHRTTLEEKTTMTQSMLGTVIDSTPDWIFAKDEHRRFLFTNRAFAASQGLEPADMVGRLDSDFWSANYQEVGGLQNPGLHADDDLALSGRTVRNSADIATLKDGTVRIFDTVKLPLRDAQNRIYGVLAYCRDVTEQRKADEVILKREAQLREAQRIAQIGSWELDLISDELTWSDEIFRIFEIDKSQFVGSYEAFLALVHPEDRDRVDHAYTASLKSREPYEITHRLLMPDGRVKYVHERCHTWFDARGTPLRSLGTVQDVSRHHEAERQLQVRDQAIASSISAIAIADLDGRITYANHAFLKMRGYDAADQVLGRLFADFWKDTQGPAGILGRMRDGDTWVGEIKGMRKDGSLIDLYASMNVVRDACGKPLCIVSSCQDLSDRKAAEGKLHQHMVALEHASRLTLAGQMAAAMAHELCQPLTAIANYIQAGIETLKQSSSVPPAQLKTFDEAIEQVLYAGRIIKRTMAFVRRVEPAPAECDINEVVRQSVAMMSIEARYRQVNIVFGQKGAVLTAFADSTQIQQVMCNLLRNAIEAIDRGLSGERQITVVTGAADGFVFVEVRDTGPGLPAERSADPFEAFSSASGNGIGLGLWICRYIIQAHGGEIDVVADDAGTCFTFRLPPHSPR